MHSKVAVLFTRKLEQEQTIDGKGGDRASEIAWVKHRKALNKYMYGNAYNVDAYKNDVALLGCSYFWCYVN